VSSSTLTRQDELAPGEEVRTWVGALPGVIPWRALNPPIESHVDLVPETGIISLGNSLHDVQDVHSPATTALAAVMSGEFEGCNVVMSLPKSGDDEVICGGPCCRGTQEDLLQTHVFIVEFSELYDGVGDLVIFGSQSSSPRFHAVDWWRLFRPQQSKTEPLPTIFTVKLIVKDDRVVYGHSQMDGLLNCSKQVINLALRKHEQGRIEAFKEFAWAENLALKNLMEEDITITSA